MKSYVVAALAVVFVCLGVFAWKTFSPSVRSSTTNNATSTYVSETAHLRFQFSQPLYVSERIEQTDNTKQGQLIISLQENPKDTDGTLAVVYGIPAIEGKGGACPPNGYQVKKLFGQDSEVCEDTVTMQYFGGYPKHPTLPIEYSVFIGGQHINSEEYQLYLKIITSEVHFVD